MRGKLMSGKDAHAMNLVNHVLRPRAGAGIGDADRARNQCVAPLAVRWTKLSVNKWIKQQLNLILDIHRLQRDAVHQFLGSCRAATAFLEKRAPVFKNN